MSLVGKKILVLGGNGFVGNYFAARLVREKASVMAMSRKGLKYDYPENSKIDWLVGDILTPQKHLEQINSADIIIHTI
jgi:nucleoside-diphosphate-sugar epimerase